MKIVISASKDFFERCIEINEEVMQAIKTGDQDSYWQAVAKQTVYGLALINQLGTKDLLGPAWEKELEKQGDRPN